MQAKQLHEVLARVVAWHNRHPLALRISPTQVHSIGGVALPFASTAKPAGPAPAPRLDEVLNPPAPAAADPFASALAGADGVQHVEPGPADHGAAALTEAAPEPAPPHPASTEARTGFQPEPRTEAAANDDAPAAPDTLMASTEDAAANDDAPIELAMALDEAAAEAQTGADATPAATLSDAPPETESETETAVDAPPAAAPDDTPFSGTETQVLPPPSAAEPAADAPLAARLQAARERAMAGSAPGDGASGDSPDADSAGVDIALDDPRHAPTATETAALSAVPTNAAAPQQPRSWLARLWAGLPLGFIRRRGAVQASGATGRPGEGGGAKLAPLFSRDFMWPRTPREVARWVQRHGADAPLAPADWPQRQVETDAALLQAARRQGLPHPVMRHVLTAAIGVGDRRIRLLIDADGRILGPRAFDRRRVGLLGGGGAALAAGVLAALLGPWRHAAPHDEGEAAALAAASAASTASAAVAESAASAASAALAAASAASGTAGHEAVAAEDHPADAAGAHAAVASAPGAVAAAPTTPVATSAAHHDGDDAAHDGPAAHAAPVAAASAPARAPATALAPASVVAITAEPPPRYPVTRASGPLVAIRFRLSDEAKQAARMEVAAARAAAHGETPPAPPAAQPAQAPALPPRAGPQETAVRVAQQPGTVYAVVTPAMPQRESAEAILAQMMSVRARIPPPVPDHGEVMSHQGRWRAAWWPFATLAEAERARSMLVARGMRAEVIEF